MQFGQIDDLTVGATLDRLIDEPRPNRTTDDLVGMHGGVVVEAVG